jgi:hypothetical protein
MTAAALVRLLLPGVGLATGVQAAGSEDTVRTVTTPFAIEDVDFTRDCRPNDALARLFTMFGGAAPADADAAEWTFDGPLYNAVGGDVSQVLRLDDAAPWHGLRLVEARFDHGIERGPVNYTLAFEDSPERVRAVWNERGWQLPPVGETRDVEGLEGYAVIGVEAAGALATVTCYRD